MSKIRMQFLVDVDVEHVDKTTYQYDEDDIKSVEKGILDALYYFQGEGFVHPKSSELSIMVSSVHAIPGGCRVSPVSRTKK